MPGPLLKGPLPRYRFRAPFPRPVSSPPVNYVVTVAEPLTPATDAVTRFEALVRVPAEALTTSDSVTWLRTVVRGIAERVTAGAPIDTTLQDAKYDTALYDTALYGLIGTLDSVTRQTGLRRFVSEIQSSGDLITYALGRVVATADVLVAATDAAARLLNAVRGEAEAMVVSETVGRAAALTRMVTDATAAIGDTIARRVAYFRVTAEALVTSDAAVRAWGTGRAITEALTPAADAVIRVITVARSTAEALVAASDAVTRLITRVRLPTEALTVADAVARMVALVRPATETLTTSDAVARLWAAIRLTADNVSGGIGDAASLVMFRVRAVTETVLTSEAVIRSHSLARALSDTIGPATDLVGRVITNIRGVVEIARPPGLLDATYESALYDAGRYDSIGMWAGASVATDVVVRGATFVRGTADSIAGLFREVLRILHLGPFGYAACSDVALATAILGGANPGALYDQGARYDKSLYDLLQPTEAGRGELPASHAVTVDVALNTVVTADRAG